MLWFKESVGSATCAGETKDGTANASGKSAIASVTPRSLKLMEALCHTFTRLVTIKNTPILIFSCYG